MDMKDYIDVSSQENTAPVYFQSLSLDYKLLTSRSISISYCGLFLVRFEVG